MDALDFLSLSNELKASQNEAHLRTAISRSYYALFHKCRESFRELGGRVDKGPKAHSQLVETFRLSGIPDIIELGDSLDDLHTSRKVADYDLHIALRPNPDLCYLQASSKLKHLRKFLNNPSKREQLQSAIATML